MGWWGKWRGVDQPEVAVAVPPAAQTMTLEERMAFRRQMVLESVRDVMSNHGLLSPGYRASVARLDPRGHQYAVMVDMLSASCAGRTVDSPDEFQAMEASITRTALRRYKIKVMGVYWRVVLEPVQPVVTPTTLQCVAPVAPALAINPVLLRRKTDRSGEGDFPNTLAEARPQEARDAVNADELSAYERALSEDTHPTSVRLGRRTYETDFSPLV